MASGMRASRRRAGGTVRRTAIALAAWGAGVLVIAVVLAAWDQAWLTRARVDPDDPAVRVGGALRTISGSDAVRAVTYDQATGAARAAVTSRYYDARKPVAENREYLATEGRLGAQLALHGNTGVEAVTVRLYAGRALLATVTAKQRQAFDQMRVDYSGPLATP